MRRPEHNITLTRASRRAAWRVATLSRDDCAELFHSLLDLPDLDDRLLVALPQPLPAELAQLQQAIEEDDVDAIDAALAEACARCDQAVRVQLLSAAQQLSHEGRISARLAAVAAVDLNRPDSDLLASSLVTAAAAHATAPAFRVAAGL